jgi:hypothetical protein
MANSEKLHAKICGYAGVITLLIPIIKVLGVYVPWLLPLAEGIDPILASTSAACGVGLVSASRSLDADKYR